MSLNLVKLVGALTRPPELQYTKDGGYPFCSFTVAVNDSRWDSKVGERVVTTDFIGCQIWGPSAEDFVAEIDQQKGVEIWLEGRLDQSEWVDKDGKTQSRTRVRVDVWRRLQPKFRPSTPEIDRLEESWPEQDPF